MTAEKTTGWRRWFARGIASQGFSERRDGHQLRRDQGIKASQSASLMVPFGAGQPRFTPRQYDTLADEGYRKNVVAYRAIQLVSRNAACIPFVVYRGRGEGRFRLEEHPLVRILQQPNPMQAGAEFFESVYAYYLIAGNSYLESVRGIDGDVRELWTLRPDRMRVIPAADGVVAAYRYQVGQQHTDYVVNSIDGRADVLHLKAFHPLDDWYGMSPLEAAAVSVDQHNDAARWNASLLQASGRPSGALVFKPAHADAPDTLTDAQRASLRSELEEYYTGSDRAGRPLVLEGGLDWREMSLSPKDMDWLAGKDVSAREIALAFHVPPQLIGIEGSLTFANFEQARLALYDDAILPLVTHMKAELNAWLAPQFGPDLYIDFDLDQVEALSPRREKSWSRIAQASFMTINEKRQALGLPPLEDGNRLA